MSKKFIKRVIVQIWGWQYHLHYRAPQNVLTRGLSALLRKFATTAFRLIEGSQS